MTKECHIFSELIGTPYEKADCWAITVAALGKLGVTWPADARAAMAAEESLAVELPAAGALRLGDVLELDGVPGEAPHMGVCLDAFRFLHATRSGGAQIHSIATWKRMGKIKRRGRPRALILSAASVSLREASSQEAAA